MKRTLQWLMLLSLVLLAMVAASGLAVWHGLDGPPGLSISVNGEDLAATPSLFGGLIVGGLLATVIALVVLPLALLLGLGLPLLIMAALAGLALLGLLSVGALLGSPLILLGLLLWWLLRSKPGRSTDPATRDAA